MTNLGKFFFTVTAAVILSGTTARAANLSVTFDFPILNVAPGQIVTFSGTVTNLEAVNVDLNGCQPTILGPFTSDCSPFFANSPLFLGPHATSLTFDMFTVSVDLAYPGPFGLQPTGTFTIFGGLEVGGIYDGSTQDNLVEAPFRLDVVPEPGTAALFCLALPVAFALRHRAARP
jgi:hypothetical protein